MNKTTPTIKQLEDQFAKLMSLNPDRDDIDPAVCLDCARQLPASEFERFRVHVEKLLEAYAGSPLKRNEKAVMQKYLARLDNAAKQLFDREQPKLLSPLENDVRANSVALVPNDLYASADWIKILENADVTPPLARAVDAAVERNRLIDTVLPIAFNVLHTLDDQAAFDWELNYLERFTGNHDPDIIRDLIRVWQKLPDLPADALEWVLQWSVDENLERQWPGVVAASDRMLRQRTLRVWFCKHQPKRPGLRHLAQLIDSRHGGEKAMAPWLDAAVAESGQELKRCMGLRQGLRKAKEEADCEALRHSMIRRLDSLRRQFIPVLLLSDILLQKPDGVYWLALATLGISHIELRRWRRKLQQQAYDIVQKAFLENLRFQESPELIIRKLAFGDKIMAQTLLNHLDLITHQFESVEDRDAVAESLAVNYASFRENELLAKSLTERYRQVMSLLHEDNLNHFIFDGQTAEPAGDINAAGLRDIYSMAGEARRYLNLRLSMHTSAEEVIAGELDFIRHIRRRRFHLIHNVLLNGIKHMPADA